MSDFRIRLNSLLVHSIVQSFIHLKLCGRSFGCSFIIHRFIPSFNKSLNNYSVRRSLVSFNYAFIYSVVHYLFILSFIHLLISLSLILLSCTNSSRLPFVYSLIQLLSFIHLFMNLFIPSLQCCGFGSGMNNPDHISESLETIFWV